MKTKFLITFALFLGIIANTTTFAMEKADVALFYYGKDTKLKHDIYTENGNYWIPLRECAEQIDALVDYHPNSMITLRFPTGKYIEYHLNENKVITNGDITAEEKGEVRNINGVSYVNVYDFYTLLDNEVTEIDENGLKTLLVSSNIYDTLPDVLQKNSDFKNSLSLLNVVEKNKNGVISPISMKLSLAMVANGTTGQTQQEILDVLGYNTLQECNQFLSDEVLKWTVKEHKSDGYNIVSGDGKILFSNSLWYNSGEHKTNENIFSKEFQQNIKTNLNGTANTVTNATAVYTINRWIEQATNGMIPTMIQTPDFETALINTSYFKACWRNEFLPEWTKKGTFYNIDATQSEVDFMYLTDTAEYCETNGWQMLGKSFQDISYDMYFFLPKQGDLHSLDSETINQLMQHHQYIDVEITIPKFEIENSYNFTQTLKAMGIQSMFENTSDFNKMYADGIGRIITNAIQKTKITVNESGTEAASATLFLAGRDAEPISPPVFKADRPFIYMLTRDTKSGQKEVLFIGQYVTGAEN